MNITQLQQPPPSQVQRVASEAEDVTPDFLSIKLVNKRGGIRISPKRFDLDLFPGKAQLFAVSNLAEWFAAVTLSDSGFSIVFSPLAHLRAELPLGDELKKRTIQPQRTLRFSSGNPNHIIYALNETRLVVALVEGPVLVYDAAALHTPGTDHINPLHSFPPTTSTAVRQIYANPGDLPDLVALLREPDGSGESQLVEVLNVATLQSIAGWRGGGSSATFPTSISWSPKGKQIAIGLQSGDIITFSPTDTGQVKMFVPTPPAAQNQSVVHTTWLSNPAFYTIFAAPGPLDPQSALTHILTSYDSKRNSASDMTMPIYFFPNGLRAPGTFTVALRNWDPAKIMLMVGDSVTADIAVIGYVSTPGGDVWQRLSSEDAATPSMPLDTEQQETVMIGFELDVKNSETYTHTTPSGEEVDVPPPPIAYAYGNDGVVVGWFVVNSRGTTYPGMSAAAVAPAMVSEPTPTPVPVSSLPSPPAPTFGQPFGATNTTTSISPFGQSSFGKPGFGSTSPFGSNQPSSQNGSAFRSTPPSNTSGGGFGAFGSSGAPAAGSSGGFAGFASSGPNAFGQPAFGTSAMTPAAAQMERSESQDMMSTDSGPSFGGLSLGQSNADAQPKEGLGTLGTFGAHASQPSQVSTTSSFGGNGGMKLSPGFGLFAQTSQSKPTVNTQTASASEQPKPSSAFGQSGFGTSSGSAFGQSGFGAKSAFGQSAFSQSAFGKPAFAESPMSMTPQPSPATTSSSSAFGGGGGFASFASGGPSSFGSTTQSQATPSTRSALSGGGGFASFASGGTSSFASKPPESSAPVWRSTGEDKSVDMTPSTVFGGPATPAARKSTTPPATPPSAPPAPPVPSAFGDGASITTTPPAFSPPSSTTTPRSPSPSGPTSMTPSVPPPANAFSGLKTQASPFGNSGAFAASNAFGSFSSDSPFANPKPVGSVSAFSKPASAFGTSTTPPAGSSGTVFGQSSSIGGSGQSAFGRSGFGTPSTPSPAPSTTPTSTPAATSAFGAFSGTTSAFGKPANSGKSFSELLQDGKKDEKDVAKDKETPKTPTSAFPKSVFSKPPPPVSDDEGKDVDKGKEVAKEASSGGLSTGSLSTSSSFVEVSKTPQEDDEAEGPPTDDEECEEVVEGEEGEGQSIDDFLSDTYSDERSQPEAEEEVEEDGVREVRGDEGSEIEEEEELEDVTPSREPAAIPLPASRSPTATPQQPKPAIFLQPMTPTAAEKKKSPSREQSTTPPGSPTKSPSPGLLQPTPTFPSPSPSPTSGIGLGRPSTRPTRSSPLANAVAVEDDDDDDDTAKPSLPGASQKPRPASPKTPFGQWATSASSPVDSKLAAPLFQPKPTVKTEPLAPPVEEKRKTSPIADRPKTPPAQSLFGFGAKPSASAPSPATTPATVTPPSSVFGASKAGGSVFGMAPPTTPGLSLTPAAKSPGTPFGVSSLSTARPKLGGLFGPPPTQPPSARNAGGPSMLGSAPTSKPSSTPAAGAPSLFGNARPMAPPAAPAGPLEDPMQTEFARLFVSLAQELEGLGTLAKEASRRREEMINPPPDLPANSLRSMDDITRLGKDIRSITDDLVYLEKSRQEDDITIRELETGVLRAKTRREEIVRFNKAKSDAEFSKMLKSRFLSPEHVELQTQLRRDIRAASDRISQMEEHLKASKKLLDQVRTGKARVRPPSLDTVNRTSRNIDIAIEQQATEINALLARVAKLSLDSSPSPSSSRTRDKRLPDSPVRPPTHITQDVATTTAAALNAEQSAQKLKEALLKVRREPLLNTQASTAAPDVPKAFASPTPASGLGNGSSTPFSTPFTLPPFNIDVLPKAGLSSSRHRASGGHTKHQKAVPLRRTEGSPEAPKSAPPAFDWGPLPSAKPMASLAFDLRGFTPK